MEAKNHAEVFNAIMDRSSTAGSELTPDLGDTLRLRRERRIKANLMAVSHASVHALHSEYRARLKLATQLAESQALYHVMAQQAAKERAQREQLEVELEQAKGESRWHEKRTQKVLLAKESESKKWEEEKERYEQEKEKERAKKKASPPPLVITRNPSITTTKGKQELRTAK